MISNSSAERDTMEVKTKSKTNAWEVRTDESKRRGKSQRRRYVRLDITSPVEVKLLVPASPNNPTPGLIPFRGEVLNVSAGGLLLESEESMPEESFVVMDFQMNGTDSLTGVVGKIKRCEVDGESRHLLGVEFCSEDDIRDNCPQDCQKLLGVACASFDEKVRTLINKYVFSRKVGRPAKEDDQ
jgi:c-di-GMP-binding flagellar brake protein YcgR